MNEEIVKQIEDILREIECDKIDEDTMAKTVVIGDIVKFEMDRIKEGGEIDKKSVQTLARIFDKFSAIFLEKGINLNLCEAMNQVANNFRKLVN